jgi:hypothetical protein
LSPSFVETTVAASPTSSLLLTWVTQQTVVIVVVDVGDVASHCLSSSSTWVTQQPLLSTTWVMRGKPLLLLLST